MSTPSAPRPPWLFGPLPDLLLGCGLGYAAVFGALAFAGPSVRGAIPFEYGPLLLLVSGTPHYGATLLRVYERTEDRRAYALFAVWLTALIASLFAIALVRPFVGSLLLTLMLTWSPWHYTGQNYGIALMFMRRAGVPISPVAKRVVYASFFLSFVLTVLAVHGQRPAGQYAPTGFGGSVYHFIPLGIPDAWCRAGFAVVGAAYAAATIAAAAVLLRMARPRQLGPAAALVATQALWFAVPALVRHYQLLTGVEPLGLEQAAYAFLWVAIGHSIQYLWISAYYARQRAAAGRQPLYLAKCVLSGAAIWALPALALAPGVFGRVPYDLGLSALISAAVNLHHFVLDGAIWKLRDGRVARVLLRSASEGAPQAPARRPPRRAFAAALWAVGAVCALAIAGPVLELELGFRPALARDDVDAAERSLERLVWMGRDSPSLRAQLALLKARQRDLDGAEREADRALALFPSADSWSAKGWIAQRRGALAPAIGAYEHALKLEPSSMEAANNLAWLRATTPDATLRDALQAVQLAEMNARATSMQEPWALDTLAAAYASALRFDLAARVGERAVELARGTDAALADQIAQRVALYRAGRPFLQSPDDLARDVSESRARPARVDYRLQ